LRQAKKREKRHQPRRDQKFNTAKKREEKLAPPEELYEQPKDARQKLPFF